MIFGMLQLHSGLLYFRSMEEIEVAELAEEFEEEDDKKPEEEQTTCNEPYLKYQHIEHEMDMIVSDDYVTYCAAHGKFLAVGTALGRVYLMDHNGYLIENGVCSMHSSPVNQISICESGDFMTSCADDGTIAIYNISDSSQNKVLRVDHEVKAIAIAPDYARSQVIVFGYTKIQLLSRGVFNRNKKGELAKAHGLVRLIKWRGNFIVWADDECVCVFDVCDRRPIAFMRYSEQDNTLNNRTLMCHLSWCNDSCFLIGRGHSLRVCQIVERYTDSNKSVPLRRPSSHSSSIHSLSSVTDTPPGLTSRYVELTGHVELSNYLVRGITRHQMFLLALVTPYQSVGINPVHGLPLELFIIELDDGDALAGSIVQPGAYTVVAHEVLGSEIENSFGRCPSLALESVPGENTHYIITPKEVTRAEELTTDDRITWLLDHGYFERALTIARTNPRYLVNHTTESVGMSYVNHLLDGEQFDQAAQICSESFQSSKVWEEYIKKFVLTGHLSSIISFIPTGTGTSRIRLDESVYETVLIELMDHDPIQFFTLLTRWCQETVFSAYDSLMRILIDRIERHVALCGISELTVLEPGLKSLWQGLALLYQQVGAHERTIDILVQLRDPNVFAVFERNSIEARDSRLIEVLRERVAFFMELSYTRALPILLDHIDVVTIDHVVTQLESTPVMLYRYLDYIYRHNPQYVTAHLILLIQLYIQFDREKLLPLLRSSDAYPLSEALALCERAGLVKETVCLLTRVGRRLDALQLILTKGGDSFVTENGEPPTEEQRQAAAAAAAIAHCREEDVFRAHRFRPGRKTRFSNDALVGTNGDDKEEEEEDEEEETDRGDDCGGELWQHVILFAADKPAFTCALLQEGGNEGLDMRLLLRKIPPDMRIPGLRDSLVKLMRNYKLQLELHRSCERILRADRDQLFRRLLKSQSCGIRVDPSETGAVSCLICAQSFIRPPCSRKPSAVDVPNRHSESEQMQDECFVFRCQHVYHSTCLQSFGIKSCPQCSEH
ncbi:Vacuolar protein sorting-associated protein 41 [Fasciola gigantica]|uniref:Vacuolar protein sorting-associated protein 41 n=1 Tax=Fasciola gigantica TaxID=46835 RepID=A0A504WW70_FASGI|nr:Vacuolar protein sorting-associated protein 41 [Fasciola gigantica]